MLKTYDRPTRWVASPACEAQARRFDAPAITETIQRALAAAGLDARSGPVKGVTDTIRQALSAAGLMPSPTAADVPGTTVEAVAREIPARDGLGNAGATLPPASVEETRPGAFVSRTFTSQAGTRTYKLYVPGSYASEPAQPVPLVVMLHGCSQSPDDFAAGTRMNALAEEHGFLVAYPSQAANANGSRCWNWFRSEDQNRDTGEPALIAGITGEVAASYRIDERRIFVAGLSAGAAMAVIMGATYPELFSAVGAHSGLPYGAAHDMASGFGAMQGAGGPLAGTSILPGARLARRASATHFVPTIVFHGDTDHTVHASNGAAIVKQAAASGSDGRQLRESVDRVVGSGRACSRTVYADDSDNPVVEHWVLHGAGHAWSGGSHSGSFTDTTGPDASAEMIRFFYSQQRGGTA